MGRPWAGLLFCDAENAFPDNFRAEKGYAGRAASAHFIPKASSSASTGP
jgi:hypothetical protein